MINNLGIEIEYANENGFLLIKDDSLIVEAPSLNKIINLWDITSISAKDFPNKPFPYFLKIQSKENYIFSFKTEHIRDFFKTFISFKCFNKEANIIKHFNDSRLITIETLENTKSSLTVFLSVNHVLLQVFYEMNCTLNQFYNYFRLSYFYNIKNEKNVIDRLLNEKLRDYKTDEFSFATRINNLSFMNVSDKEIKSPVKHAEQKISFKFEPIYPKIEFIKREPINSFKFPQNTELEVNFELETERVFQNITYDDQILKKLLEECKKIYKSRNKDEKTCILARQIEKANINILKDAAYKSFRPSKYI
ncbi:hypothetical protein EDEG_00377 [Edhazardia aedis USNM 41457]|uniref:Uncharacterized protein n=1 Tax=Edhazardia aedis (strain USNM 41457) TaxID=1003232 RepID=J9D1R4_EDHAE|nr:hypothetical protein EDEG_00377 [Edhazardia aedis USNM 41457]|eukprot:EJW01786.1 hypothetical protein EDEG_00377 [Edhazardia aedis USNM 41457]